jgi:hypothetical protein
MKSNSIADLDVPMDDERGRLTALRASKPPAPGRAALDSARPIPLNRRPGVLFRGCRGCLQETSGPARQPAGISAPGRVPTPHDRCNRRAEGLTRRARARWGQTGRWGNRAEMAFLLWGADAWIHGILALKPALGSLLPFWLGTVWVGAVVSGPDDPAASDCGRLLEGALHRFSAGLILFGLQVWRVPSLAYLGGVVWWRRAGWGVWGRSLGFHGGAARGAKKVEAIL